MSYHERMRLIHERMNERGLDIEEFNRRCRQIIGGFLLLTDEFTDNTEIGFLVQCIIGDVMHDIDIVKRSIEYLERMEEEE